ncbi:hypothetical protein, partial [Mesorhizobium sp. M7A.F.Ca.CA.001.12.2.1]|uniref:hypothetical protein n=1 Tax=Mesorhizobium sp. M7A.F.Ca.CA.001.12.2.1 TaxID=2496725 RepID=UPI0019CF8ED4
VVVSFPESFTPDVALADTFLRNAAAHLDGTDWAADRGRNNAALHAIAIAIELLLKSYLLRVATDDCWNRAISGTISTRRLATPRELDCACHRNCTASSPGFILIFSVAAFNGIHRDHGRPVSRSTPATSRGSSLRLSWSKSVASTMPAAPDLKMTAPRDPLR